MEGIYRAVALKGTEQWGESAGKHIQCNLSLKLEEAGDWPTALVFSPESAHFAFDRLKAMGWDGANWPAGHEWEGFPNLSSIWGKTFFATIVKEDYQGKATYKCEVRTGMIPIEVYKKEERAAAAVKLGQYARAPRPARAARSKADGSMPDDGYFDGGR